MKITFGLGGIGNVSMEDLKRMISELEVIAKKEIDYDPTKKDLVENPGPIRRKIGVTDHNDSNPFWYTIFDYASDREDPDCLIGTRKYHSIDLASETKPSH